MLRAMFGYGIMVEWIDRLYGPDHRNYLGSVSAVN